MSDIVNNYFKKFYPSEHELNEADIEYGLCGLNIRIKGKQAIFPRMVMKSGLEMSVQGHYGAYSSPRDDWADNYSSVEVGYPTEKIEELMPYIDAYGDNPDPTDSVYAYVPVSVLCQVIEKNGGITNA